MLDGSIDTRSSAPVGRWQACHRGFRDLTLEPARIPRRGLRSIAGSAQTLGPWGTLIFCAAALGASIVILIHQERVYERDPDLRTRAGLVVAQSDISLMRVRTSGAPWRCSLSICRRAVGFVFCR